MIEKTEIIAKLFALSDEFRVHARNKEYWRAMCCYDTASAVAHFLELEEEKNQELFGERGERGVMLIQGKFNVEEVLKVQYECIKTNDTYENRREKTREKLREKSGP